VHLPANFDPNKPINLVIYNHGYGSTAKGAYSDAQLGQQMANAPPNTVLVVPEWQRQPGSRSSNQGNLAESGQYKGMLQEIFDKTPGLQGKKLDDVANISIIAHSAGFRPTETELYQNGLASKVKNIALLDALYDHHGFDSWLKSNIKDLHDGNKHFYNIFNDTTNASRQQADRVKQMARAAGLPETSDSIVFRYSNRTTNGHGPHGSMPSLYFGAIVRAS
jgi:hypothetical protein